LYRFGVKFGVKPRRLCRFCRVIRFITLIRQELAFSNSMAMEEVVGSIPTRFTNLSAGPGFLSADPGLELRSRLFQNDSELPFVVETA
jgi:hypothetical protein